MKEIKAYIKRHRLGAVADALRGVEGLTGMSAVHIHGFGRGRPKSERGGLEEELGLLASHVKLEVVCRDACVDEIVAIIQKTAHTGLRGDGKIYVSRVDEAVRISTGERGEEAV